MDKLLRIGQYLNKKPFCVDIEKYAAQGNNIFGVRGMGKTWASKKMEECVMDAGIPIIVFDPIGRHRFLKVGIDGNPGYPIVVIGGKEPDLPLNDNVIEVVRAAMRENISIVIDLFAIDSTSKTKWVTIVTNVVHMLLMENEEHGLRHIFLEEAHQFIPQFLGKNQNLYLCFSEFEKLALMGRNVGVGYTLISQRIEQVNKSITENSEFNFLFRQTGKNSLKGISDWLKLKDEDAKKMVKTISKLPKGQCYAFEDPMSPALINIDKLKTYHPEGHVKTEFKADMQTDVSEFVQRLKEAMETKPVAAETETREEKAKKILRSTVKKVDKPKIAVTSTPEGAGRIVAVGVTKDKKIIREKDMHKLFENDENEISAEEKFKDVVYQKERAVFADEIKNAIKNPTEKRAAVSAGFKQISDNLKNNNMEFNEENFKKVLMQNTQLKTELSELRNSLSGEALVNARGVPVYDLPKEETGHIDYGRIVSEVVKHLLGERRVISPIENVKHQFLTETIDKIMNDINGLNDRSRKILLYVEQAGKGVRVGDIVTKCFKLTDNGDGNRKPVRESIAILLNIGVIKWDKNNKVSHPRLWTRIQEMIIDFVLEDDGMSLEAQVQNLYDVIIMKLSGEK